MSISTYNSFITLMWFVFEIYLVWINYKGRYKYGLLEYKKSLFAICDKKINHPICVLLKPIVDLFIIIFLIGVLLTFFKLSFYTSFSIVMSSYSVFVFDNLMYDHMSVKFFEQYFFNIATR